MSVNLKEVSIVQWLSNVENHKCGYCKDELGNVSNGMCTETLTVEDYQDLIDRGWRRSGKYCYKPVMNKTCCPQYTIRCDTSNLQLSKSQKKVIKKFNKFLTDGVLTKSDAQAETGGPEDGINNIIMKDAPNFKFDKSKIISNEIQETNNDTSTKEGVQTEQKREMIAANIPNSKEPTIFKTITPESDEVSKSTCKPGLGADSTKPPCKKAKQLRLERKKEKLLKRGMSLEKLNTNNQQKSLEDFILDIPSETKHKLKIKLVPTSCPGVDWELTKDRELDLYKKYQVQVHNDNAVTMGTFVRFLVTSPLKIKNVTMNINHETFHSSYLLYKKYQMSIHNEDEDECDLETYEDFLIMTPLKPEPFPNNVEGPGYGSFHQQYWLDDKLIAVEVVDILPKCISSVYFFYDPDYRSLTLGTYGSLRELLFIKQLNSKVPAIRYYYMGFYIHSCVKMRYKGNLNPSYLLCPETYNWFPIEKCVPKLEISKYSRLSENLDEIDEECGADEVDNIKILIPSRINYKLMLFESYKLKYGEVDIYTSAAKLVGKQCLKRMLFISTNW